MKKLILALVVLFTIIPCFAQESSSGVAPEQALSWLKNGNTRFRKGLLRRDGTSTSDRARLAKGQKPHSIILSCSDSRVPPEVVFDQKLGEIFTVRTAGESLGYSVIASIEYAIEHLGSRLVVVMGHTSCGAVKATLSTMHGEDAGSPNLNKLTADLRPHIKGAKGDGSGDIAQESLANAKGAAEDLIKQSEIIAKAVKEGKVKIVSALYHLDSGAVDW